MKNTKIWRVNTLSQHCKVAKLIRILSHNFFRSDLRLDLQRHLDRGRGDLKQVICQTTKKH